MKMKNYAKWGGIDRLKNGMRNLTNFDLSTQKSQKFAL